MGESDLFKLLADLAGANLAGDEAAKDFLRTNGIGDESVWSRYRLGACTSSLLKDSGIPSAELQAAGLMGVNGFSSLTHGGGIVLPTFSPDAPEAVTGLVKISFSQHRRSFVTQARGLGFPADLASCEKVLVCDNPLQGLRLACGGVRGVLLLLSQHLETLDGAMVWLAGREVVAVSPKRLDALLAKLKPHVPRLSGVALCNDLRHANAEALRAVGADPKFYKGQPPSPASQRLGATAKPPASSASAPASASVPAPDSVPGPVRSPAPAPMPRRAAGNAATLAHDLVAYAQERLREGEGQEVLQALGVADGEMAGALELGFLPKRFQQALSATQRRKLKGKSLAGGVVLPALDEGDRIVDLLAVWPSERNFKQANFSDKPQGLLCARVPRAYPEVILVDSFRLLTHFWNMGLRNLILIRSEADVRNNAPRLRACGVQKAHLAFWSQPLARKAERTLKRAGIEAVTAPALHRLEQLDRRWAERVFGVKAQAQDVPEATPPAPGGLRLIEHDRRAYRAAFEGKDAARYTAEVAPDAGSRLEVRVEKDGTYHLDRFDLSVFDQRRRFARTAALKTKVPCEQIEAELVLLLDAARALQAHVPATTGTPKVEVTEAEKLDALPLLKSATLLDEIADGLERLGWVGEEPDRKLLFLVAISRKLPRPLSAARRSPAGSGKSFGIERIAEVTPPEDLVQVSRLTDSSLYHQADALRHKLLVIDEADALTPEVLCSLRVLQSRGALTQTQVVRDAASGAVQTQIAEARGPVAVLTSTTAELEEQTLSRCFDLGVDDSPEQTERILAAQRRLRADPGLLQAGGERERIVSRLRAAQRLLECRNVFIPFAERIAFPATSLKFRREQERFLNLIEASALLHQYQRLRDGVCIVADIRDYEIALALAGEHIARAGDALPPRSREVLDILRAGALERFSIQDLQARRPGWPRSRFYEALEHLCRLEVLTSTKGRGKVRTYQLQAEALVAMEKPKIALRPASELLELLEGYPNNFTPSAATG